MIFFRTFANELREFMEDVKEFDILFRQYYEELYFFAMQFLHDSEESKDVVSDAFEDVWFHYATLQRDSVRFYLYRIVRNKCIDILRHQKIRQQYAEKMRLITKGYDDSMDSIEWQEREVHVQRVLDALQPPTKDIFMACYVDHLKYAEVAKMMAISIDTVKKHVKKALRFIREIRKLSEWNDDD